MKDTASAILVLMGFVSWITTGIGFIQNGQVAIGTIILVGGGISFLASLVD